uniref:Major facilitator superfamily (MFS) profile domain-containing protein n=1 Tax=Clastoptera arizonana TaxID=38151 RepID=A0A1B6DGH9_9HEMI
MVPNVMEIENGPNNDSNKVNRICLYFSTFTVNLLLVSICIAFVWTSPTLVYLLSPESHIPITKFEGSWIASFITLGGVFGAPVTGVLLDSIGRKWTLHLCTLLLISCWIWTVFAVSVVELYLVRFITGLTAGISYSASPLYVAEISEDSLRGALNTIPLFSRSLGYLITYSLGSYLNYQNLAIISVILPTISFFLFFFVPESPYYLIDKNCNQEAKKVLNNLRRGTNGEIIDKEISIIQNSISISKQQKLSYKDLFSTVGNIRAFYICTAYLAFQQFSGVTTILLYAESIFLMVDTPIPSSLSATLVGGTMMVSACIGPILAKKMGFIKPMIISSIGLAIFLAFLGLYFILRDFEYDVSSIHWLPITSLLLYCISYSLGMGSIPWAIMGEIFAPNIKSVAAGIMTSFNFLAAFITAITFPILTNVLGWGTTFWLYSALCVLVVPFTIYFLPDTHGKSLDEIQVIMNKPRKGVDASNG